MTTAAPRRVIAAMRVQVRDLKFHNRSSCGFSILAPALAGLLRDLEDGAVMAFGFSR